jgi:hypothetical protein
MHMKNLTSAVVFAVVLVGTALASAGYALKTRQPSRHANGAGVTGTTMNSATASGRGTVVATRTEASFANSQASDADTAAAIISAALTPDGHATPQDAAPGGSCARVVTLLGFWSCSTVGETCAYQTGHSLRHCACRSGDGDGQPPSWTCD